MAVTPYPLHLTPQLIVGGGWGEPYPPPLAFDFLGGEGYDAAKRQGKVMGVARMGSRGRNDKTPDNRPLTLVPRVAVSSLNNRGAWSRTRGASSNDAKLKAGTIGFSGGPFLTFTDNSLPNEWEYTSDVAFATNEGFALEMFISDIEGMGEDSNQSAQGHCVYARWGKAGRGWKLQVLDGNISLLHLSSEWNETDEHDLHGLWQLNEPTPEESALADTLYSKLYDTGDSLSFEGGIARDEWVGQNWKLAFLPEPRGVGESGAVHLLSQSGAVATVDLNGSDYLDAQGVAHVPTGDLWEASRLSIGATGGAVHFQLSQVRYVETGTLSWGPYKTLYDTQNLGDLQTFLQVTGDEEFVSASLAQEDVDALRFKFNLTLSTTDARYTPWLHLLSGRLEEGPRSNADDDTVTLDTLALEHDAQPTRSIQLRAGEDGTRSAHGLWRDVNGNMMRGHTLDDLQGHTATLKLQAQAWITGGNIPRGSIDKMKQLAEIPESGTPLRGGLWTSKGETEIEAEIDDGSWLCGKVKCRPAMIYDGLYLGESIRRDLRRAGYTDTEISLVPSQIGPIIPRPAPGNGFSMVSDAGCTVWSSIQMKMDRFGAGLRLDRLPNGKWCLETIPATIKFNFTSNGLRNDPALLRAMDATNPGTREIVLHPLKFVVDNDNYFTVFTVEGGKVGRKIVRSLVNRAAVKLGPGGIPTPLFCGHHNHYDTLIDEGLDTVAKVNFALRSLKWRYGRPGRIAQFETFLHPYLRVWDRGYIDGILVEVVAWDGTIESGEPDKMQIRLREIVT